jgi:hypothetical protein
VTEANLTVVAAHLERSLARSQEIRGIVETPENRTYKVRDCAFTDSSSFLLLKSRSDPPELMFAVLFKNPVFGYAGARKRSFHARV